MLKIKILLLGFITVLAVGIFYLFFFIIAPFLCNFFELTTGFGKLAIYGIVAYFGGIGIPITLILVFVAILIIEK